MGLVGAGVGSALLREETEEVGEDILWVLGSCCKTGPSPGNGECAWDSLSGLEGPWDSDAGSALVSSWGLLWFA